MLYDGHYSASQLTLLPISSSYSIYRVCQTLYRCAKSEKSDFIEHIRGTVKGRLWNKTRFLNNFATDRNFNYKNKLDFVILYEQIFPKYMLISQATLSIACVKPYTDVQKVKTWFYKTYKSLQVSTGLSIQTPIQFSNSIPYP